jgi:membrane protease YdiL (CAAX protease family)
MTSPFVWLACYLTATVLVGAVLAWPLGIALGEAFGITFERVLSRTLLLTAVVFVVIFLRVSGKLSLAAAGFAADGRSFLRSLFVNFAFGLLAMGAIAVMLLATGLRFASAASPGETFEQLLASVPVALTTGIVVGLFEETYFRGLVMAAVPRGARAGSALIATSLFFAIVHFLAAEAEPAEIRWHSGLRLVAEGLSALSAPAAIGALVALAAGGLLLGTMRLRDGHIASCAGFHAGWVTGYTLTHRLTDVTAPNGRAWLIGPDGVLGWLAFVWIAALLVAYVLLRRVREPDLRFGAS